MHSELGAAAANPLLASGLATALEYTWLGTKVLIGFSVVIFVHELGHFLAAKWMGVRVDRFAVGFFYRLFGYRRGEGFTFGPRATYTSDEQKEKSYGETDYCFNAFPFGGYVKMLGQDDIILNEETGEIKTTDDPRAFTNKPVWRRMIVVSAGVVFNMLFAVLAYMAVYLLFIQTVPAPVIGIVEFGGPAERAGLLPNDRVISVDGQRVRSFRDVAISAALGGENLRVEVERNGKRLPDPIVVPRKRLPNGQFEPVGLHPCQVPYIRIGALREPLPADVRSGDRVTQVNGVPVDSIRKVVAAFQASQGRPVELTVEPAPDAPGARRTPITFEMTPKIVVQSTQLAGPEAEQSLGEHILGFVPRRYMALIAPNSPAVEAGFVPGDAVVQWDNLVNPLVHEIVENITAHKDQAIPVVVERNGALEDLSVTPRASFDPFGTPVPKVGVGFRPEQDRTVVARIVSGTPAAALLNMPDGAELTAIDEQPVHTWAEVYEALCAAAGRSVTVSYRHGETEDKGRMQVPGSFVNELGLPRTVLVVRVDGQETVELKNGEKVTLSANAAAASQVLKSKIGQTVKIEYYPDFADLSVKSVEFTVGPDNFDPWQLRIRYAAGPLGYSDYLTGIPFTEPLAVNGNVFRALMLSLEETGRVLHATYNVVRGMITNTFARGRGPSVKNVAGPIGIIQAAVGQARASMGDLLFFLAYISINLAVLNFLPIPIVDGGLMAFLLLEKIRGKPLSIKLQVITTLTGLGLIVVVFLIVTIQDISRLLS